MIILTETATGTKWQARKSIGRVPAGREFWIAYYDGPRSAAQPGIVGFYAPTVEVGQKMLGDCTRVDS